jgi:hypothetical protein
VHVFQGYSLSWLANHNSINMRRKLFVINSAIKPSAGSLKFAIRQHNSFSSMLGGVPGPSCNPVLADMYFAPKPVSDWASDSQHGILLLRREILFPIRSFLDAH